MPELPRRRFLAGLTGIICAPAIVRASSLMAVRSFDEIRPIPIKPLSPDFGEMIRIREQIEKQIADFTFIAFSDIGEPFTRWRISRGAWYA